jgi:mycothiol synthase
VADPDQARPHVRRLAPQDAGVVLGLLDRAEREGGAPLVDEAEHERLRRLAEDGSEQAPRWRALVAERGDAPVGYGGLVLDEAGGRATGDVAVVDGGIPVRRALLEGLEAEGADRPQIWMRHLDDDGIEDVVALGYRVERRLGVLGRDLAGLGPAPAAGAARIRPYRPGEDDDAVVEVLSAAYVGTDEAGWDHTQLRERRDLSWFRAEDLLLGELPGDGDAPWVGGLHWLKRRGPGVGEVYNLAIHPDAQGAGLGGLLLYAGLEHLQRLGCAEVILWVDLGNERAVELYTSQGFVTRWQDVAVGRAPSA